MKRKGAVRVPACTTCGIQPWAAHTRLNCIALLYACCLVAVLVRPDLNFRRHDSKLHLTVKSRAGHFASEAATEPTAADLPLSSVTSLSSQAGISEPNRDAGVADSHLCTSFRLQYQPSCVMAAA
jgi:hypothetical protein